MMSMLLIYVRFTISYCIILPSLSDGFFLYFRYSNYGICYLHSSGWLHSWSQKCFQSRFLSDDSKFSVSLAYTRNWSDIFNFDHYEHQHFFDKMGYIGVFKLQICWHNCRSDFWTPIEYQRILYGTDLCICVFYVFPIEDLEIENRT